MKPTQKKSLLWFFSLTSLFYLPTLQASNLSQSNVSDSYVAVQMNEHEVGAHPSLDEETSDMELSLDKEDYSFVKNKKITKPKKKKKDKKKIKNKDKKKIKKSVVDQASDEMDPLEIRFRQLEENFNRRLQKEKEEKNKNMQALQKKLEEMEKEKEKERIEKQKKEKEQERKNKEVEELKKKMERNQIEKEKKEKEQEEKDKNMQALQKELEEIKNEREKERIEKEKKEKEQEEKEEREMDYKWTLHKQKLIADTQAMITKSEKIIQNYEEKRVNNALGARKKAIRTAGGIALSGFGGFIAAIGGPPGWALGGVLTLIGTERATVYGVETEKLINDAKAAKKLRDQEKKHKKGHEAARDDLLGIGYPLSSDEESDE